jgi:hypothetical protein
VSNGQTFVLFWVDNVRPAPNTPTMSALVAKRVSGSGQSIDPEPVVIGPGSGPPAVASAPNGYAAVTMVPQPGPRLRRYRIDESLHSTELSSISTAASSPGVTWNGSDFVAYWIELTTDSFVFKRVAFESNTVDTIASGNGLAVEPLLAWNGSRYLAVWMNGPGGAINAGGGDVAGFILSADGIVISTSPIVISVAVGWQGAPRLAHVGNTSLVVWQEKTSDTSTNLVGVRIGPSGAWLDRTPFLIAAKAGVASVVALGSAFLVVYPHEDEAGPGIYVNRVDVNGGLGPAVRIGAGYSVSAASNGSMALIAFTANTEIVGVRIEQSGQNLDPIPFLISNIGGFITSIASNGTDFLVVWNAGSDYCFGGLCSFNLVDVYATRVFASGTADIPIEVATGPKNQKDGIAASDGRDYVIAYSVDTPITGQRHLATKRIRREGQLADGSPTDDGEIVATTSGPAAIVAASGGYVLAWENETWASANSSSISLRLTRLDERGKPSAVDYTVSGSPTVYFPMLPSMTSFGPAFQLVYARFENVAESSGSMRVFVRAGAVGSAKQRSTRRRT